MKFAYADPPYIGQAKKHYGKEATYAGEVDHAALIDRLGDEYPDGWALSASSPSLRELLPMCPPDVRVLAWVKPFAVFKPNVGVAYAWEPVIFHGGRKRTRQQPTIRDWVSANITLRKGLVGAKPLAFCYWLFDVFNVEHGDVVADLFPGTGAVTVALDAYIASGRFLMPDDDDALWDATLGDGLDPEPIVVTAQVSPLEPAAQSKATPTP